MNLYESINENLDNNKSKASRLADLVKEKYSDINYLKEQILLHLKNDPSAVRATENTRQPVHAGPYMALMTVCKELLPEVDSKSVQKGLAEAGIDYKELLQDACNYVKEAREEEKQKPTDESVEDGELVKPTPEEEEFFEKNENLVWSEYAARTNTDLKDISDEDVDYDTLLQVVRDLIESLDTGIDEADQRTYKDKDEAEYYRNKELYAQSGLERHKEAMEKARKACEEKGIKLEEENLDESRDAVAENLPKFIYDLCVDKGNAWSAQGPSKTLGGKVLYRVEKNGKSEISNDEIIDAVLKRFPELKLFDGYRHDGDLITFIKKEPELHEETLEVNDPTPKRNYTITDITVLEPVGDGDVRAIDVQELLTKVDESLSEKYGQDWGHINIVTSRKTLDESSATFELRLKESNYAMNFIVSGKNALKEFQVYTTMGKQIYNKKTMNVVPQMEAYVEQFLDKSLREEKNELESKLNDKAVKNTIEEYVRVSGNRESAILLDSITREIKFYKDMKKDLGEENESVKLERDSLQSLIHRLVSLLPLNTAEQPEQFKKLNLGTIPDIEAVLFSDFMKEVEPKDLKESYQIFNIGNMQVVYNSSTQEVTYSIDSKDVQDKKINLTKIPSVEVPYDTETIIKNYIEKQVGRIAQDGDEEKVGPDKEAPKEPVGEVPPEQVKEPVEKESLSEDDGIEDNADEKPEEPGDELDAPEQSETGSAIFVRKPQTVDQIKKEIEKGLQENKSTYIVAKTLTLSPEEFKDLSLDLSKPREYFKDLDVVDSKNYAFNVIEVTGGEDTLLIDNAGSDFAKYVAIKNL